MGNLLGLPGHNLSRIYSFSKPGNYRSAIMGGSWEPEAHSTAHFDFTVEQNVINCILKYALHSSLP